MTVGVVLLVDGGSGDACVRSLLGAPVAVRALAATLPAREAVVATLVAPQEHHAALQAQATRFGLTEVRTFLSPTLDLAATLRAALGSIPANVDTILLHDGLMALCPVSHCTRLVSLARDHGAAVSAWPVEGPLFERGDTLGASQPSSLVRAGMPLAARRSVLEAALKDVTESIAAALGAHGPVATAFVDRDLFALRDSSDVTRALEVWGRRAPEYAFIWPRPGMDTSPEATANLPKPGALNITIPDTPLDMPEV